MATIGVLGSKGGVGKTTIARAIVVESVRSGLRARLCDLDPQGSAVDWCRLRISLQVEPVVDVRGCTSLAQALQGADELDHLVVDCPGRPSTVTLQLATVADLVVLPSGAGVDDLRPHGPPAPGTGRRWRRIGPDHRGPVPDGNGRRDAGRSPVPGPGWRCGHHGRDSGTRGLSERARSGQAISEIGILTLRRVAEQVVHEIGEKLA